MSTITIYPTYQYIRYIVGGEELRADVHPQRMNIELVISKAGKVLQRSQCSRVSDLDEFLKILQGHQEKQAIQEIIIGPPLELYKNREEGWMVVPPAASIDGYDTEMKLPRDDKKPPHEVKAKFAFNLYDHAFYVHRSIEDTKYVISEFGTGTAVCGHEKEAVAIKNARDKLLLAKREAVHNAIRKHNIINL